MDGLVEPLEAQPVEDSALLLRDAARRAGCRGRRSTPLMFGPAGLGRLVAKAIEAIGRVSFTLEIHPTGERLSLGDAAPLFGHWLDKTNAEQMNHWLSVLGRNHALLLEAIKAASSPEAAQGPISAAPSR